jgi:hypothetical protein
VDDADWGVLRLKFLEVGEGDLGEKSAGGIDLTVVCVGYLEMINGR